MSRHAKAVPSVAPESSRPPVRHAPTPPSFTITVHGVRPLAINKKQAGLALGSIKTLQRMLWSARHQPQDPWLKIVREGGPGTECLIDTASVEAAYARIYQGEKPPLMPSERLPRFGRN